MMRLYLVVFSIFHFLISPVNMARLELKDYMIAGALSTSLTDFILYPLDTIKVTQQSNKDSLSFPDAAKLISRTGQGVRSFFNGAIGYAALDGCSAAIFFALYEETKVIMSRKLTGPALGLAAYPSAAIAFLASTVFLVPAELVKTRMQTSNYLSVWDCIHDSTHPSLGGLRALYTGYLSILVRDLPYFSLQLGCYDNFKNILSSTVVSPIGAKFGIRLSPQNVELIASVASGFITGLLTNPMDVVTARLITQLPDENSLKPRKSNSKLTRVGTQGKYSKVTREGSSTTKKKSTSSSSSANTNSKSASGSKQSGKPSVLEETKLDIVPKSVNSAKYKGLVDCIVRMWNEEGPQAFFTGAVARVAWIAPFTAISLGINERLKRQFLMWKPLATVVPRRTYFFRKFY